MPNRLSLSQPAFTKKAAQKPLGNYLVQKIKLSLVFCLLDPIVFAARAAGPVGGGDRPPNARSGANKAVHEKLLVKIRARVTAKMGKDDEAEWPDWPTTEAEDGQTNKAPAQNSGSKPMASGDRKPIRGGRKPMGSGPKPSIVQKDGYQRKEAAKAATEAQRLPRRPRLQSPISLRKLRNRRRMITVFRMRSSLGSPRKIGNSLGRLGKNIRNSS